MSRNDRNGVGAFGRRLEDAIAAAGMTNKGLAEAIRRDPTTDYAPADSRISEWIHRWPELAPPVQELATVARHLGVSAHWLLTGEGAMRLASEAEIDAFYEIAAVVDRVKSSALRTAEDARRDARRARGEPPRDHRKGTSDG